MESAAIQHPRRSLAEPIQAWPGQSPIDCKRLGLGTGFSLNDLVRLMHHGQEVAVRPYLRTGRDVHELLPGLLPAPSVTLSANRRSTESACAPLQPAR